MDRSLRHRAAVIAAFFFWLVFSAAALGACLAKTPPPAWPTPEPPSLATPLPGEGGECATACATDPRPAVAPAASETPETPDDEAALPQDPGRQPR